MRTGTLSDFFCSATFGTTIVTKPWVYVANTVSGPVDGVCSNGHGDGPPVIDGRVRVGSGRERVEVSFRRDDRPDEITVYVYRHLDANNLPTGRRTLKKLDPRPTRSNGAIVGWKGRFSVVLDRPRYLKSAAYWTHDGCDATEYGFYVYPALLPS